MSAIEFAKVQCWVADCPGAPVVVLHQTPGIYAPATDAHLCEAHRDVLANEREVRAFTLGWEAGRREH